MPVSAGGHVNRISLGTIVLVVAALASLQAVPSAPTSLAAQVAGSTVTLSWTPSAVGPVTGYLLEAGSSSGQSDLASVSLGPIPAFVATVVPAGTYFIRVRAIGLDGVSEPSNEAIVTVTGGGTCTVAPVPPTTLTSSVNGMLVSLSWQPGGGCQASNFALHAGTGPGLSNVAVVNLGTGVGLTASAPPGTYYIRVLAQNAFGSSAPSNEVVVQVGPAVGLIILSNDDWVLSDSAFSRLPVDTANLARNIAALVSGSGSRRIHAYSDYFSLTGTQLANTLRTAGYTFTSGLGIAFNLPTLATYDAIFLGLPLPTPSQLAVLDQYVAQGGNLYIHGGNGAATPNLVPSTWNPLLTRYGLAFNTGFNGLLGNITVSSGYPLLSGVSRVYIDQGHPTVGCCVVATTPAGSPLFAVSRGGRIP